MLTMIIPDTGEQIQQDRLFFQCKKNQNCTLLMQVYKDITHTTIFNLSTASVAFTASAYKGETPIFAKLNDNAQWDKTNASSGILRLNLVPADVVTAHWLFGELVITISGLVYRSPDIIIDVQGSV